MSDSDFSTPTRYLQTAMSLHTTHHPLLSRSSHLKAEKAKLPQPPLLHHGFEALAILVGLRWTLPSELLFILSRESKVDAELQMQSHKHSPITPPNLLDMHLLRQPRMPLALFKTRTSSRTPNSLSAGLLSRNLAPGLYCGRRLFLLRGRLSRLPLLNFKSSVVAHFPSMLRISLLPYLPVH